MIILLIDEMNFEFLDDYECNDFEIIFFLEYHHSFSGNINIVFAYTENIKEEKEYFILYKYIFGKVKKTIITNNEGRYIIELIENAKISIKPPEKFGLDGCSYIITFFNNGNFAQYRWWNQAEGNWGEFQEIIEIIFKYIDNSD